MTNIRYTLLAEGIVESEFIPGLLKKIFSEKGVTFSKSNLSIKPSSSPSKSKVLKKVEDFSKTSIIVNEEDLFIVGVDLDEVDHDLSLLKKEETKFRALIPAQIEKKKVVVFIPVQAFDHWLLYQNYKIIKGEQKIVENSLESKSPDIIKKTLYGKSNPDTYLIKNTVKKVLGVFDADELSKQSKSFKHFHDQLKKII